jgi:transposase-like protein
MATSERADLHRSLATQEFSSHLSQVRYRRAIKACGHFPFEQAALKCLYLVTRSLDSTGVGRAFAITFGDSPCPGTCKTPSSARTAVNGPGRL